MRVRGVEAGVLKVIAEDMGMRAVIGRTSGRFVSFVLRPGNQPDKFRRYSASFFRLKSGERRRVQAICYHGHYQFMDVLFTLYPTATLVSQFARYDGRASFLDRAEAVADRYVGAPAAPVAFGDLCKCDEAD